jgi:hypothetical protein
MPKKEHILETIYAAEGWGNGNLAKGFAALRESSVAEVYEPSVIWLKKFILKNMISDPTRLIRVLENAI